MEQFRKFFARAMIPRIEAHTLIYEGTFEDDCEKTWRAALEWVLSWETDSESKEIINKELGDT